MKPDIQNAQNDTKCRSTYFIYVHIPNVFHFTHISVFETHIAPVFRSAEVRPSSSKAAASASASVCPMMERERSERPQPVGTGGTTFDYLQQQLGTDFFWRSDAILIYWICYVHMYSIYIYIQLYFRE